MNSIQLNNLKSFAEEFSQKQIPQIISFLKVQLNSMAAMPTFSSLGVKSFVWWWLI